MKFLPDSYNASRITASRSGPRVLITAGVHGDEYEPMVAAVKLISEVRQKLVAGNVTILPIVNSSAWMAGTREGGDGLDLARICPGKERGSWSEQSAATVSRLISESDYYIDMHTGGREFNIYPLAGYMLHESREILRKQQQMAQAFNLPVIWGTESSPQGRTLSVARDAGVPAIYIEFGGGEPFRNEIVGAYVQGCLGVLASLGMMTAESRTSPALKFWVEDFTPHNGHLQSKMPAPLEGIFVPSVSLGETVKQGHTWGTILNMNTMEEREVHADHHGVVLFIRATSLVRAGQSLGGILPVLRTGKTIIP